VALEDSDGGARRTSLAGERTLLAWWRTGLTAIAVALGVGRLLPELAPDATQWPYAVLGVGFSLYGIALFVLGQRRWSDFERSLGGDPDRSADRLLVAFTGAGVILGLGALVVIVAP
jgi:putative membrane protein